MKISNQNSKINYTQKYSQSSYSYLKGNRIRASKDLPSEWGKKLTGFIEVNLLNEYQRNIFNSIWAEPVKLRRETWKENFDIFRPTIFNLYFPSTKKIRYYFSQLS